MAVVGESGTRGYRYITDPGLGPRRSSGNVVYA